MNSEAISTAPETAGDCVEPESPSTEATASEAAVSAASEAEESATAAKLPDDECAAEPPRWRSRLELLPLLDSRKEIPTLDATPSRFGREFALKAAAAGLGVLALIGAGAAYHSFGQTALQATQTQENERLVSTVASLRERLDALETARAHEETADIRKILGELKAQAAATHDVGAAIGQLTARVDHVERDQGAHLDKFGEKIDHEASSRFADLAARLDKLEKKPAQAAPAKADDFKASIAQLTARLDSVERDEGARVDKLGERLEHVTSSRFADLATRMDKLEKRPAAPAVAMAAPAPAKPVPIPANVSNETTGSIEKPKPPLRGYMVVDVRDGFAMIEGREGAISVAPGDTLPGLGRVLRIERRGRAWDVVTSLGVISSEPAPY